MVTHNPGLPGSPQSATATQSSGVRSTQSSLVHQESVVDAAMELFKEYSRERPEVVAMWAFGIGFVLGWKLKPW